MMDMGTREIRSLNNLVEGETGEIIQVRGKPETHRFLYSKGLVLGQNISVSNASAVSADTPITIMLSGTVSTIGREMANNIKVRLVS